MKKLLKIAKITGVALLSILIAALLFVVINSKMGSSKINVEIDGFGTRLISISSRSIDLSEQHFKLAFSFNDKINIKVSPKKISEIRIRPFIEFTRGKVYRSKNVIFHLDPASEIVIRGKEDDLIVDYEIIKGNKLSYQQNELRKSLLSHYEEESRLLNASRIMRKTDPEKADRLVRQFDSLRLQVVAPLRTSWGKEHLQYEIALNYW